RWRRDGASRGTPDRSTHGQRRARHCAARRGARRSRSARRGRPDRRSPSPPAAIRSRARAHRVRKGSRGFRSSGVAPFDEDVTVAVYWPRGCDATLRSPVRDRPAPERSQLPPAARTGHRCRTRAVSDILLVTLNARYSHASLGLRYLYANMGALRQRCEIVEFVIGARTESLAERILARQPRIVGFGVYIWNVEETARLVAVLARIAPE